MFPKKLAVFSVLFFLTLPCLATSVFSADPGVPPAPAEELERELTDIEKELADLENRIDTMLEDLVDPKITSISVFFASGELRGAVPASLQVVMDGDPMATKMFEETDRLILLRGGAIEVHAGIIDPAQHTVTVECLLTSSTAGPATVTTGKTSFRFEARRAAENYLEITLSEDLTRKPPAYVMAARSWSKEP